MSNFNIEVEKVAEKQLQKLDKSAQKQIVDFLDELLVKINVYNINPFSLGKPLMGNHKGLYRFRTGNYRLIGKIEQSQLVIYILKIGHRKDIYE
jgi:mRNA interferase RelE/StbE